MMHIGNGKRDEWEFEYTAAKLAEGATAQKEFRLGRVRWWQEAQSKVMAEVKETGIEVTESVAAAANYLSNTTSAHGPAIRVRTDLQQKLSECHSKIQGHQQAAAEYDGWIQVLRANPESRLKLTHADWLYFFGRT